MNWQAFFDGVLAAVALAVVLDRRQLPAVRLGCAIIGIAAALGTLRFSGLLPLPSLHQLMSLLGAAAGLPLLAVSVIWRDGVAATEQRYAWILAVVLSVIGVVLVINIGFKPWSSGMALASVVGMLAIAALRRQWMAAAAAACLLAALLAFAGQMRAAFLQPGDFLHIGMAAGLALLAWGRRAD